MSKFKKYSSYFILFFAMFLALLTFWIIPRMIVVTGDTASAVYLKMKGINSLPSSVQKPDSLSLKSHDNLVLKGLGFKADSAVGTIIFLHGIRASKEVYLPQVERFLSWKYNVVLIDHRAHGESQGKYCTFGKFETIDVSLWIDQLLEKGYHNNMGVWGQSLGGAIGLQCLAHDARLKFGIIESTFADFRTIAKRYIDLTIPVFPDWYKDYVITRASKMAKFNADSIQPAASAKAIKVPVLMAHGGNDRKIPPINAEQIFENLASPQKEFHIERDAGHVNIWATGGEAYFELVEFFLVRTRLTESPDVNRPAVEL